jgi:hypothetical protein
MINYPLATVKNCCAYQIGLKVSFCTCLKLCINIFLLCSNGGRSANKFRIQQIRKCADLNNLLDARTCQTVCKCCTLWICKPNMFL